MKELQCDENFACVELRSILIEFLHQLYMVHEITTVQIFHNEEEILLQKICYFKVPFCFGIPPSGSSRTFW